MAQARQIMTGFEPGPEIEPRPSRPCSCIRLRGSMNIILATYYSPKPKEGKHYLLIGIGIVHSEYAHIWSGSLIDEI